MPGGRSPARVGCGPGGAGKSLFVFVSGAGRNQADLFTTELDLKFVAGLEVEQGRIGLADQQVAIALHRGHITQLAPTLADLAGAAEVDALGLEQGLVEGREIEPLSAVLLI